ncbi:MAG: hypothetical protein FWC11_03640 [Firmicutes bacterium]|nr:hypothetical protein [Bacillota bacterium]MCL2255933.1 hypothetical protein [Bacillota bacterium]
MKKIINVFFWIIMAVVFIGACSVPAGNHVFEYDCRCHFDKSQISQGVYWEVQHNVGRILETNLRAEYPFQEEASQDSMIKVVTSVSEFDAIRVRRLDQNSRRRLLDPGLLRNSLGGSAWYRSEEFFETNVLLLIAVTNWAHDMQDAHFYSLVTNGEIIDVLVRRRGVDAPLIVSPILPIPRITLLSVEVPRWVLSCFEIGEVRLSTGGTIGQFGNFPFEIRR